MPPSISSLPKKDIPEIMRHGARSTGETIMLRFVRTGSMPRFAFVVSTKVDKRATQRNRIKRLLRESVRYLLPRIRSADAVMVVRKNIASLSQADAEKIVLEVLTRAGLL